MILLISAFKKILNEHDKVVRLTSEWYTAQGHPDFFSNALRKTEITAVTYQ